MYLNAVLVVYESQDVVARNRVTACGEYKLAYIFLVDKYRFLLVEAFANGEEFLLLILIIIFLA